MTAMLPHPNTFSAGQSFSGQNYGSSYGSSYGLVSVHNLQTASVLLFGENFAINQNYDTSASAKINPPSHWGGDISMTVSGASQSGFSSALNSFTMALHRIISNKIGMYPQDLDASKNPTNSKYLIQIVDEVYAAFADKLIFVQGLATTDPVKVDAQRFYNDFQVLVKEIIINVIVYQHQRMDYNYAWAAVCKSWKTKLNKYANAVTSSSIGEVESACASAGIDYKYFGSNMIIIDSDNTNFLFVAKPDIEIKVHSVGACWNTLNELGLL
jgi:hypothetical protein